MDGYLNCTVAPADASLVSGYEWLKDEQQINPSSLNTSLPNTSKLVFNNLTVQNKGSYKCIVTLSNDQKINSSNFQLNTEKSRKQNKNI